MNSSNKRIQGPDIRWHCLYFSNKSIENFEDVVEAINIAKLTFKINYVEFKPHEGLKGENITYNQSLNNDWYFAPTISNYPPYETVICLIMAPFRAHKHNPDWGYRVSYFKVF